jgi:putative PIN family toxin of toxin-antitoxin system
MSTPERLVIDTNVWISATLIINSLPNQLFQAIRGRCAILCSDELQEEIDTVILRKKFDRYVPLPFRQEVLRSLRAETEMVSIRTVLQICRDPHDNHILELAVDGQATHIITGDDDLLVHDPFQGIRIVTPQMFLADRPGSA